MRSTVAQRRRDGGRLGRGVEGQRARSRRRALGIETLEGRRVLTHVSYVYGIDDSNKIFEIDPAGKTLAQVFVAESPVTGGSNAFAYDRTSADREFLFFMNGSGSTTGAGQNLYVWNKLKNEQSLVADTAALGIGSAAEQPANAAFFADAYWFFEEGQPNLYKIPLDYPVGGGSPTAKAGAREVYPLGGLSDGATPFPTTSNFFGDIAINPNTGVLYASNRNGFFYSLNINAAAAGTGSPTDFKAIGSFSVLGVGMQLSFSADYSTLYGQEYVTAAQGNWYTIDTTNAGVTSLNWTPGPDNGNVAVAFRDLGGPSPVSADQADLKIEKSDGETTVFAGDGLIHTYTITVTNNGPDAAREVSVADTWPEEFTRLAIGTPSVGTVDPEPDPDNPGNFTWSIGTLAANAVATLTVTYTVPFGTAAKKYENTAVVTSSTIDPNPDDNTVKDPTDVVSNALAAGTDLGCNSVPFVYVINPYAGTLASASNVGVSNEAFARFNAYPEFSRFRGGVRVAVGDVDNDGVPDVVTAPGPGIAAPIKVFNLDGSQKTEFEPYYPFGRAYRDGIEINVGDVDGDPFDDLVASKSRGPGEVQVALNKLIEPPAVPPEPTRTFEAFKSFTAFGGRYRGGATAAIGSRLGDDLVAIIVGSGPGMRPMVKNYTLNSSSGALAFANQYAPVMPTGTAGVSVTTQKFTGGVLDTLVAAGRNGNSKVSVYQGGNNVNTNNYSPFASLGKPNAPVFAAASSLAGANGDVDTVFMAQGDGGVNTIKKVNATTGVVDPVFAPVYLGRPIVSPLRVATNVTKEIIAPPLPG